MNRSYYQGAQIAFVCYDRDTINTAPVWVHHTRELVPDCVVFLVATKRDVYEADPDADAEVRNTSERYKMELGATDIYYTSALNDVGSIKLLFEAAAAAIDIIDPTAVTELSAAPQPQPGGKTGRECGC
jgi:GTPase SAR1 family protein